MNNIELVALELQNKLLTQGFIVERLKSNKSNSIYLKIDYGVCYIVRVSDHKEHTAYSRCTYNIGDYIEEYSKIELDGFLKYFFPSDYVNLLVQNIIELRKKKIKKIGKKEYKKSGVTKSKLKSDSRWEMM